MDPTVRRIAIDAMGCERGCDVVVDGALAALESIGDDLALVGHQETLESLLNAKGADESRRRRIEIIPSANDVTMGDSPSEALRKRDSSVYRAAELVRDRKAFGMVSAGNTGATMFITKVRWRALPGVSRPAIATVIPAIDHPCILLDVGANVDCKPRHLLHFAVMGAIYAEEVLHVKTPRVGLLSIGEEQTKGNALCASSYDLLEQSGLNFIGNVEGGDILTGKSDVVACDGFIGNVVLKFGEGLVDHLLTNLKKELGAKLMAKLAAAALMPSLRRFKSKIDPEEFGGAPLLGVNGICLICHGSSSSKSIKNAIRAASESFEHSVNQRIVEEIGMVEPAAEVREVSEA